MSKPTTEEIIQEFLFLVEESKRLHSDAEDAAEIAGFFATLQSDLNKMRTRCIRSSRDYKVAVVGLGNVGKSTLINAILGERIAPVSNAPCTASIVEFRYGAELQLKTEAPGSLIPEIHAFSDVAALHKKLCSMVAHEDNAATDQWERIEVSLPADILSGGLILADTPGFGAAGEEGLGDTEIIENFLKKDAAQIFWIVMADQGIGKKEHDFYNKYLTERCDDLVATNAENWDEEDRKRWKKRYAPKLHSSVKIHFAKGKQAKTSRGDPVAFQDSGVADLCERIKALKKTEGRLEGVMSTLRLLGEIVSSKTKEKFPEKNFFDPLVSARLSEKIAPFPELTSWGQLLSNI
jgi:GTP-binding protein EngB required for normal cell division